MLIGLSPGATTLEDELSKVTTAGRRGVATITDLTTSGDDRLLKALLDEDLVVGTVPAYALIPAAAGRGDATGALLGTIERHVTMGVDFLSVHPSLTTELVEKLSESGRTIPITSRGGALVLQLMVETGCENPFRAEFDTILAICAERNVVLSFVGSLRPGSVADSFEPLHLAELAEISTLADRARRAGVRTIVELVNHTPLSDIESYVRYGRSLFPDSALGALGPTPTDIAVGLDDVAGAIGAATAALAGIDWINLVTAGEHSHLPSPEETARALDYFQLALHIARVANGRRDQDRQLSLARAKNDWTAMSALAVSPELAEQVYAEHGIRPGAACSMCRATCPLVRYEVIKSRAGAEMRGGR